MALNETKKKNLEGKEFDELYSNKKQNPKWAQLANNAYEYAKKNITQGKRASTGRRFWSAISYRCR